MEPLATSINFSMFKLITKSLKFYQQYKGSKVKKKGIKSVDLILDLLEFKLKWNIKILFNIYKKLYQISL